MKKNEIIAAIDIGSASIIAALAELSADGEIYPLAFAETPSKGVKKGGISNIELAQHSIDLVLEELQVDGSYHIHSMIASLSGSSIIGYNIDSSIEVKDNIITEHYIKNVISKARNKANIENRQLLHILEQDFIIDKQMGIDNPIGLKGEQLGIRVHIISAAKTAYYNLLQTFSHRDINIETVISSGYASALATTTPDERQLGICVLDIGAGTTDITVIKNDKIIHSEVIQIGGEMITSDIAFFMKNNIPTAEEIKCQIDVSKGYAPNDYIDIYGLTGIARKYAKQDIANVAQERCTQLINIVMQKLQRAGVEYYFPGGFVICGGSANLMGIDKVIMHETQLPARIAKIAIELREETKTDSRFATIMGLFLSLNIEDHTRTMTSDKKSGIIRMISGKLGRIIQQIRG